MERKSFLRSYGLSLALLAGVVVGSVVGACMGERAGVFKPLGQIFLNLMFVTIVPLIFFSISSAVAGMSSGRRLLKVLLCMLLVFAATGVVASAVMVVSVKCFPPSAAVKAKPAELPKPQEGNALVRTLTVPDFGDLLRRESVLPLILFAALAGLATSSLGEKGKPFATFLASANEVFLRIIGLLMYAAPVGIAALFAAMVGSDFGPDILSGYGRVILLYFPVCIGYFFAAFTLYAFLAGGNLGVRRFWSNIAPPSLMALGSCSSFATIPLNLEAADRVGIPRDISEVVIPIGAQIHMDGSCLAAIVKIAFLAGIYPSLISLNTPADVALAIGVSLLVGMVMSGVPGGGYIGELLLIGLYHLPGEAYGYIVIIGAIVDAPATLVNSIGDNVASMLVARILNGPQWLSASPQRSGE